ncbi:uncharacterized protein LOC129893876 isoform X2 [Solanum dulcamara]|uniref:uncharacterized protein LOC129893876 isoform X2 n=1 Tax=Solanum dulcamara TaxID=45834 RepID=UPI00248553C1|nr:uncharacterized protein LOC129893876 isoform X2 [Solanum dulcamara]
MPRHLSSSSPRVIDKKETDGPTPNPLKTLYRASISAKTHTHTHTYITTPYHHHHSLPLKPLSLSKFFHFCKISRSDFSITGSRFSMGCDKTENLPDPPSVDEGKKRPEEDINSRLSMGCDKTENLPDPSVDDLSLSVSQSGAADYNGAIQGGFGSGANVTSFPFVSLPAVRPLPGNVHEIEVVDLINPNTLHHHHLQLNLMNVRNISPSFSSPSEMPYCMENSAEINHSNMNNKTPTSDSLMNQGVLSKGIQNSGASINFMPMQSSGAGFFEKSEEVTGISQNSFQASGSPFGIGYNVQNAISIGGIGIHNDANINHGPFSSRRNIDGSFLTLGMGSNIEDRTNLRFSSKEVSGKEVSSRLEEAVLPQSNNSLILQMRRNLPSLTHGAPGGITNFQRDSGGFPNSAWNSGVLAPDSRISAPPFMYATPDERLNLGNTRSLGAVGRADLRLSEPDPLMYARGGLPPPLLPFSSNSTLPPHLGFGRMAAAPGSDQPFRVAAQSTINQQNNQYTNILRNQSSMGPAILSHGGDRVRQDHLGQQSFVNVLHPWGNNLYPEGMGAQIPGWIGIQPAPVNQFPKRLGVQLNDGAISQATREGVLPGTVGIQQTRGGNSYQSQDHGPKMHPTELLLPPFAMGRPQGGSSAEFNVSGLPYHAGQGVPISKVDVAPQGSYIDAPTSLKRRRPSRAPPTAPTCQRRRTLTRHSNQQLIAHQRPITIAPVPASSPSLPSLRAKLQGLEEPVQPVGEKCMLCKRNVMFNPEGPFSRPAIPPAVAVLPCGHVFHDHCLQKITPQDQSNNPPCIPCAIGET